MAEPGAKSEIALVKALDAACEAARERWRANLSEENLRKNRKTLVRLTDFIKCTRRIDRCAFTTPDGRMLVPSENLIIRCHV